MAFNVNSTAPCTPRELGVLPRRNRDSSFTVEFLEFFKHNRSCGHVDAERKSFGREHCLDKLLLEEFFNDLLKCGQHASVMGSDTALEPIQPIPVAENGKILVKQGT